MITNLLRRFCADEVKILLTHIEEHYEDFDYNNSRRWETLLSNGLEGNGYMTSLEKFVVKSVWRKVSKENRRKRFLGRIVKEKLAPEKDSRDEVQGWTPPVQGPTGISASPYGATGGMQAQNGYNNLAQQAQQAQQAHINSLKAQLISEMAKQNT
jgi:hypothetical protein